LNEEIKNEEIEGASKITIGIASEDLPETCSFTTIGSPCEPQLQFDTLYKKENKVYLLIPLEEKSSITITAVDKAGNEIKKVENKISAMPLDKLAPGQVDYTLSYDSTTNEITVTINSILSNIDGSPYEGDTQTYFVFQGDLINLDNLVEESSELTILILVDAISGDTLTFSVLAIDANNPVLKLSTENPSLEINAEYQEIIEELSNPQDISIP